MIKQNTKNVQKISSEQIERLYRFTREHFVEHYDLQTELVDHLAFMIEDIWQTEPELPFESALQKAFKSFGVFGFSDIVEERSNALNKRYNKIIWKEFKSFFTPPKLLLTAFMTSTLYGLLYWGLKLQQPVFTILVALALFMFGWVFVQIKKNIKKINQGDKKLMFAEIIAHNGNLTGFAGLPLQFFIHLDPSKYIISNELLLLISFLFVSFVLITYVMTIEIPKKVTLYVQEVYPELSLS